MMYDYESVTADKYRCKTLVDAGEPELRVYVIDSADLSEFVTSMRDPQHGEEIINVEPVHDGTNQPAMKIGQTEL